MLNCTAEITFITQFLKSRLNYLQHLGQSPPTVKHCGCAPVCKVLLNSPAAICSVTARPTSHTSRKLTFPQQCKGNLHSFLLVQISLDTFFHKSLATLQLVRTGTQLTPLRHITSTSWHIEFQERNIIALGIDLTMRQIVFFSSKNIRYLYLCCTRHVLLHFQYLRRLLKHHPKQAMISSTPFSPIHHLCFQLSKFTTSDRHSKAYWFCLKKYLSFLYQISSTLLKILV